jgi:hypothetical protein
MSSTSFTPSSSSSSSSSLPPTGLPLKALSRDAIPRALEKAERYRLLNEPAEAESICLDILSTDPGNQPALVTLLLALTDQFGHGLKLCDLEPRDVIARLAGEYDRAYYSGIVSERQAKAVLEKDGPHAAFRAHDLLVAAMRHYEAAAALRPPGNDDALLRWNTCARMMNSRHVNPRGDEADELLE